MTLYKMVKEVITTKWIKTRCECGQVFEYPEGGYKPPTCANPSCVQKYLHPELNKERR